MHKSYIVIAYRNLIRNKAFSIINILGLSLGMAACFLITQYVRFELSYDKFHEKHERIYRVTNPVRTASGEIRHQSTNHPGAGPALKEEFPEVEEYARLVHQSIFFGNETTWSYTDSLGNRKAFTENRVYDADPSFLTMFSFPVVWGDVQKAANDPSSIVITDPISKKYFGSVNPIGKALQLNKWQHFTIGAVIRIPENSHIQFDILTSLYFKHMAADPDQSGQWKFSEFWTYVLLHENADPAQMQVRFPAFIEKHLGERLRMQNSEEYFHMESIADIHLKGGKKTKEQVSHGDMTTVYFLSVIAVLILVIAWINYINLSTAKALNRAAEVGMRKVVGASKAQLFTQFMWEAAIINFIAIAFSITLVTLVLPAFNQLSGKNLGNSLTEMGVWNDPYTLLSIGSVFLFGTIFTGAYPAMLLSTFKIVNVIKGKFFGSRSGIVTRKILVGFQFTITVALIAGTLTVFNQVSFMRQVDLGYVKEELLIIKAPRFGDSTYVTRLNAFKTEVKRDPHIVGLAPTTEIPGKLITQVNYIRRAEKGTEGNVLSHHFNIDHEFAPTYGLEILAGRNFREGEHLPWPQKIDGNTPIMLNEAGIRALGFSSPEEAANQLISFGLGVDDVPAEIVGVLENHHQRSLKEGYDVILYFPRSNFSGQYFTVRMKLDQPQETIAKLKDHYERLFPGNPFEYFFLDEFFDRQYKSDQQFGKVFGLFSVLALVVACLGLFGLTTFMITQRIKEIAVRKVLGATIGSMIRLFSRDFIQLILIANAIALPVVYYLVDQWLNTFAFRAHVGWTMFVIPAAVLLLISLTTVGLQTLRTSLRDPVKALRSE